MFFRLSLLYDYYVMIQYGNVAQREGATAWFSSFAVPSVCSRCALLRCLLTLRRYTFPEKAEGEHYPCFPPPLLGIGLQGLRGGVGMGESKGFPFRHPTLACVLLLTSETLYIYEVNGLSCYCMVDLPMPVLIFISKTKSDPA